MLVTCDKSSTRECLDASTADDSNGHMLLLMTGESNQSKMKRLKAGTPLNESNGINTFLLSKATNHRYLFSALFIYFFKRTFIKLN